MITVTHLYTARSNTDANSYVTPSNLSPSADRLVIGVISNRVTSGTAGIPTLTGGGVSTWTTYTDETRTTDMIRLTILYGRTGSSPTASQVTVDFAGATQGNCEWSFFEISGAIDTGTNGVDAFIGNTFFATTVNTNTQSLTLPTFSGANSVAIGAYYIASSRTATAISPSTFLGTITGVSEAATLTTVYNADETTGVEFTGTNASWLSIAVEIGAAVDVVLPIVQLTPFRARGINGRFN